MAVSIADLAIRVDASQLRQAQTETERLTQNGRELERTANQMSSSFRGLGSILASLGISVSFMQAIKEISSFETKLNSLHALTMASTAQMKEMEKQARELGATTAFSAQQSAEAQGVLASAGLKVNEILTATPKVLQLAAAGSLELSRAAEIATGTMRGFGLGLGDLGRINDVLAKTAADTSTSVEQIGDAMKNAAPIAKAFGINLEDMSAAIGILADNQIKGGEAGNNFKAMLSALGNETKERTELLKQHGLTYADLNVQVRGLQPVMESLRKVNLSGAEAITLFGTDAAAAGLILSSNAPKIDQFSTALDGAAGSAKQAADILNQGLAKAWDALLGTLSEAVLQLGDVQNKSHTLKEELTGLITSVTGVIAIYEGLGEKFAESNGLTKEQYENLKNIAGELQVVGGAAGGIAVLATAIWSANVAMLAFNATARLNPLITIAGLAAAGIGAVAGKIQSAKKEHEDFMKSATTAEEANLKVKQQIAKINAIVPVTGAGHSTTDAMIAQARDELKILVEQRNALEEKAGAINNVTTEISKQNAVVNSIPVANKSPEIEDKASKKAISDAEQHAKAIKDLLVSLADQQYQMDLVSKGKLLEAEISKNLMSVMSDEIMAGGELSEINKAAKEAITAETTAIYNKTDALRIQQAMWDESVRQANELYDINKGTSDLQEIARMAESLHLMGATNEEIKKRIDLEKLLNNAIKSHPDQDPQVVRDSVIAQQRAADEIAKYTDSKTSESAKWMEKAFEQAARNIQDSFASMFESMLNGDATASFAKFAENIRKTLNKAISQQLALDLQGLFSENGSIMNVLKSGLLFLVASIPSFFGKKQDSRQLSPAEVGNSSVLGTGAMHIADSFSRDLGYEYQNQEIIRFNRSLDSLASGLMTGIKAGFENFSTQISEFGTKIIQLPIVNSVVEFMKPVTEIISKAYSAISEMIGKGVSFITDSISSITNSISNIFSSTTDVATTAALKATETSASIIKSAGTVIAVIGAIYSAFTYFSGLGDMLDRGNIGEIFGTSMQLAGSIIAAGAMIASSGIGVIVGAVVAIVGALVSLFTSSTRVPNAWMNTYNPDNSGNPLQNNSGLGTYNADVGKSAYVGEYTPFGVTVISTHEANLSIDQMNNAFGELLKTVKTVDINLYNTVNRLDDAFGQAGKTMDYYNRTVVGNNRVATKNNLSDLDTGNMLSQRYAWIVDILGNSGSIVGQYINAWFDVITNKFITVSQSNSMFVLGVIDSLSAKIESFMQFPLGLVNLIGQSVKATNMGGTPDSVMAEISGVFDTYLQVQSGLKQLGMGGDQGAINESIVRFLADVNRIGFAVKDAGINLLAYAIAMQKANGGVVDALYVLNDANSKLMSLKSQGLDNSQITAYIGSFGLMANLFSEAKVAFTSADLASAAQNIHNLSQASVNVARNTVDHAIATEKLTNVTRESAIATLVKSKTLDEATVAESEYGVSIAKVTKEMLSNLAFIQQIGYTAGASLGEVGISAAVWQAAANNVVAVFGDLATAMKAWDSIAKTFLSSTDYAKYNLDTINRSLANMAAVNPNLAQLFTPENIAAALKSGQSMAHYINILASGNGELAKESFSYIDLVMKRIEAEKSLQSAMQDIMQTYKDIESWLNKDKRGSASGTNDFARNIEYLSQMGDLYNKAMKGDSASVAPLLSLIDEYKGFLEKYSPAIFAETSEAIRVALVSLQNKVGIDTGALPSHANGVDSVPYDGYVAKLHQGERVLTASESRNYSAKDDKETIAMLVELIRTEREGFKQVINELRIANKNTSEVKASARRAEVKA